jgi:type III secretion protein R
MKMGLPIEPLFQGVRPLDTLLVLAAIALAPVALVMLTSFVKMTVVLSVTRSALGAPQVPPSSVVTGLSLILSLYVMTPVMKQAHSAVRHELASARSVADTWEAVQRGAEPLRHFLLRMSHPDDRALFVDLSLRSGGGTSDESQDGQSLAVVAPAFVLSELRQAFVMGFMVFLPFLVIDIVIANILLALGLVQLSPTSISLPFKLLLFVAVDGWKLLVKGLVGSYFAQP